MKNKNKAEAKIEEEIAEAEKEITEIEEKVEEHRMSQKEADKKIKEEVDKEVKKVSEEITEVKEDTKEKKKKSEKEEKVKKPKKTEAVVYGKDLPISTKHAIAICDFIRGKKVEDAIFLLEEVLRMKRAVPMKGEIPHRKGKIMSGRYPINAARQFVKLLKQLAANASVNEIELEKGIIECKADRAAKTYKRFGNQKFKRSHVTLKLTIKYKGEK